MQIFQRKTPRASWIEYNEGMYFITICTRDKKHYFGMIQNAYIRVLNPANNEELLRYNLTDNYGGQTALITGEIYRNGNEWKFGAIGTGTTDDGLSGVINRYR